MIQEYTLYYTYYISQANCIKYVCVLQDSLAAEIEGTMRKEIQMSDPEVEEQRCVCVSLPVTHATNQGSDSVLF